MKSIISTLALMAACATLVTAADKSEDAVKKAFAQLDRNHDGFVTLAEWRMSAMTDPTKTDAAFKAMDKSGRGKISYDDFKAGMQAAAASAGGPNKQKFTKAQVERRLRELEDLHKRGLITDDMYERKKAECETSAEK
jgi:EF-hand domain pair